MMMMIMMVMRILMMMLLMMMSLMMMMMLMMMTLMMVLIDIFRGYRGIYDFPPHSRHDSSTSSNFIPCIPVPDSKRLKMKFLRSLWHISRSRYKKAQNVPSEASFGTFPGRGLKKARNKPSAITFVTFQAQAQKGSK